MATVVDPRAHAHTEVASQWRLMWWSFRRHRLAMIGLTIVILLYLIALFAEFFAPFDPQAARARDVYHPPQRIHFVDTAEDGSWRLNPWVQDYKLERDKFTLQQTYVPLEGERIRLDFLGSGEPYTLWGLFALETRLLVPEEQGRRFYLFGADRLGRDMFSRVI